MPIIIIWVVSNSHIIILFVSNFIYSSTARGAKQRKRDKTVRSSSSTTKHRDIGPTITRFHRRCRIQPMEENGYSLQDTVKQVFRKQI